MPSLKYNKAVVDYLTATGLAGIVADYAQNGRIGLSLVTNPNEVGPGCAFAYWLPSEEAAKSVLTSTRQKVGNWASLKETRDVLQSIAREKGVQLVAHGIVISRVQSATSRLNKALSDAAQQGLMSKFHREYRRRRLAAAEKKETFIPFVVAKRRFALALVAKQFGNEATDIIGQVFEPNQYVVDSQQISS